MVAILIVVTGCNKDENLSVTITQQPTGGIDVQSVSVSFEGKILSKNPKKTISVTCEWWWENGNHENSSMEKSEQFTFNSDNATTVSSTYSVGAGYFLLNYYWVKLIWTDDSGSHILESGKAFCF